MDKQLNLSSCAGTNRQLEDGEIAPLDSQRWLWRQRCKRTFYRWCWPVVVQAGAVGKRTLDCCGALVLFGACAPLFLVIALALRLTGVRVLRTVPHVGRWCEAFSAYEFFTPDNTLGRVLKAVKLVRLPLLLNIVKGDLSFIGPRLVTPGELPPRGHAARARYDVRPGLLCLWWIRQRTNIDYGTESESDREYVDTQSIRGDVGLALRAMPSFLYGQHATTVSASVRILDIPLHNVTMSEALEIITEMCSQEGPHEVYFVNPHCANIAYHDPDYRRVLQQASLTLADGIGIKIAGKLLGQEIKQNVNGTDLFPRLCASLTQTKHRVFLLGGRPGVPEKVQAWIATHYPEVVVCGSQHGYFSPTEAQDVIQQIADSQATILLVAFGVPQQEKWIHRHVAKTGVKVALGVGGLFDFYSGRIPRAPQWVREMGGEWLYRLYQEPQRMWRRYVVGNTVFLWRVLWTRTNSPAQEQ